MATLECHRYKLNKIQPESTFGHTTSTCTRSHLALGSQVASGRVSTEARDHSGTPGAECFFICFWFVVGTSVRISYFNAQQNEYMACEKFILSKKVSDECWLATKSAQCFLVDLHCSQWICAVLQCCIDVCDSKRTITTKTSTEYFEFAFRFSIRTIMFELLTDLV